MDNMAGKNSLLDIIFVSERASTMVDEDLKRLCVQDVLLQYNEGDAAERRKLTSNLCALRKAERDLRDVLYSRKKASSRHGAAQYFSTVGVEGAGCSAADQTDSSAARALVPHVSSGAFED